MSGPEIVGVPVPVGGAITLYTACSGTTTLSRAISGTSGIGTFTQIYSGLPLTVFIDVGDGLPAPLASGTTYVYKLTDQNGSSQTAGINLNLILNIQQEPILNLLTRIFQAGISNLSIPQGVSVLNPASQITQAMPLQGQPPLPQIVVNLDLVQQAEIPIGQNVEQVDAVTQCWTITGFTKRIFRISVLASNVLDREFYRDAIIAIFEATIRTVFQPIGLDVRHSYQAHSGQVASQPDGMAPGFFYSDVLLEFQGIFNITISPNYGPISTISMTPSYGDGVSDTVTVPIPG